MAVEIVLVVHAMRSGSIIRQGVVSTPGSGTGRGETLAIDYGEDDDNRYDDSGSLFFIPWDGASTTRIQRQLTRRRTMTIKDRTLPVSRQRKSSTFNGRMWVSLRERAFANPEFHEIWNLDGIPTLSGYLLDTSEKLGVAYDGRGYYYGETLATTTLTFEKWQSEPEIMARIKDVPTALARGVCFEWDQHHIIGVREIGTAGVNLGYRVQLKDAREGTRIATLFDNSPSNVAEIGDVVFDGHQLMVLYTTDSGGSGLPSLP